MLATALVLLALASPADSSRWTMGPDVTDRALTALHAQGRVAAVRFVRLRPRDAGYEATMPVDTLWTDASWLMRFEQLTRSLPQTRMRVPRLVAGQTYPFLFRIGAPEGLAAPDAWVDFRGPAVMLRAGSDSTLRSLRGHEGEMALLLRRLDPADRALRLLGQTCGLADALPDEAPIAPPPPVVTASAAADSSAPEVSKRVAPVYPAHAREQKLEGTVLVKVLVDAKGLPAEVRVVQSVPGLDNAAVAAVARWTFTPAKQAGRPVEAWVVVPVVFKLK